MTNHPPGGAMGSTASVRATGTTNNLRRDMASFVVLLSLAAGGGGADGFAPASACTSTHRAPSGAFPHQSPSCSGNNAQTALFVGRGIDPDADADNDIDVSSTRMSSEGETDVDPREEAPPTPISAFWAALTGSGPPLDVDDAQLLIYDVFLLSNLAFCISFFVVHRLDPLYVPSSLHEGAALSICWIVAGLANGAFLRSAVDGHYDLMSEEYAEKGGPRGAGLLALSTFVTTSSLRIASALVVAVVQHRPVGRGGEELIPLEILFGLVLMSAWRCLHSAITPRI